MKGNSTLRGAMLTSPYSKLSSRVDAVYPRDPIEATRLHMSGRMASETMPRAAAPAGDFRERQVTVDSAACLVHKRA